MNIFDEENYRKIIISWLKERPNKGRGEYQKIAEYLGIQGSVLSQIMSEKRELGPDLALKLSKYMNMMPLEQEYFVTLASLEKAHHFEYKDFLSEKLRQLRSESQNFKHRVNANTTLSLEDQTIFYSSWIYSAIRLRTSIRGGVTVEQICEEFQISSEQAKKILSFLLEKNLVLQEAQKFVIGPAITFVGKESPHLPRHQMNWRLKSLDQCAMQTDDNFLLTVPMSCSAVDAKKIRKILDTTVQEILSIIKESEAERLFYFGIDLYPLARTLEK